MGLENFENNIFLANFQHKPKRNSTIFFEDFFGEYFKKFPKRQSPKGALVTPIIPFGPSQTKRVTMFFNMVP